MSAKTSHFSIYSVVAPASAEDPGYDTAFKLGEVYAFPNPAVRKGHVNIHVEVGQADQVDLRIYNQIGEKVHDAVMTNLQVIDGKLAYEYSWDVSGVASGVYLYVTDAKKAGASDIKTKGKFAVIK